jgi:hypothetical protein
METRHLPAVLTSRQRQGLVPDIRGHPGGGSDGNQALRCWELKGLRWSKSLYPRDVNWAHARVQEIRKDSLEALALSSRAPPSPMTHELSAEPKIKAPPPAADVLAFKDIRAAARCSRELVARACGRRSGPEPLGYGRPRVSTCPAPGVLEHSRWPVRSAGVPLGALGAYRDV